MKFVILSGPSCDIRREHNGPLTIEEVQEWLESYAKLNTIYTVASFTEPGSRRGYTYVAGEHGWLVDNTNDRSNWYGLALRQLSDYDHVVFRHEYEYLDNLR
jgi:hypothetical protein